MKNNSDSPAARISSGAAAPITGAMQGSIIGSLRNPAVGNTGAGAGNDRQSTSAASAMKSDKILQQGGIVRISADGNNGAGVGGQRSNVVSAMKGGEFVSPKQVTTLRNSGGSGKRSYSEGGGKRCSIVKNVQRLKEKRKKDHEELLKLKEQKNSFLQEHAKNPNGELKKMISEYKKSMDLARKVLQMSEEAQVEEVSKDIMVIIRKRPLSQKELLRKEIDVISVPLGDTIIVYEPRKRVDLSKFVQNHNFRFDYVFDEYSDNAMIYRCAVKPLVQTIFDGGRATCFAYGQTGTGKTHTMGGEFNGKVHDCKTGIYGMAAKDIFDLLNNPTYSSKNLTVSASFFEIYKEQVFDLLSKRAKLHVYQDGKHQVQVIGLTEKLVNSVEEMLKIIKYGNAARTSGETKANANSSRSHAVFQIILHRKDSRKSGIFGKFSLIDLAGNERGSDTFSTNRQTQRESADINQSLLALKECIRALGRQSSFLPFRVSKLTQVLRDSFIGVNSKICMIAMVSPALSSCEHTLNTLRYADRVKELAVNDCLKFYRRENQIIKDEENNNDDDDDDDDDALQISANDDDERTTNLNGNRKLSMSSTFLWKGMRKEYQSEPILHYWRPTKLISNQIYSVLNSKMLEFVYQDPNNRKPIWEWNFRRSQLEQEVSDGLIRNMKLTREFYIDHIKTIKAFLYQVLKDGLALNEQTENPNQKYMEKIESLNSQMTEISEICLFMLKEYNKISKY